MKYDFQYARNMGELKISDRAFAAGERALGRPADLCDREKVATRRGTGKTAIYGTTSTRTRVVKAKRRSKAKKAGTAA